MVSYHLWLKWNLSELTDYMISMRLVPVQINLISVINWLNWFHQLVVLRRFSECAIYLGVKIYWAFVVGIEMYHEAKDTKIGIRNNVLFTELT